MPEVTYPAHKDGDVLVNYEEKVFEDVKANPGEKALVTFHGVAHEGSIGLVNTLVATRLLRNTPGTQDIAVIALTANASAQHRQDAQQSGANAFLAKPFDRQELLDLIGQTLGLNWVRETDPPPPPPTGETA